MEQHVLADPATMFSLSNAHLRNVPFMAWCAALCPADRAQELFDLVAAKVQCSNRFTKTLMSKNDQLWLPAHLRERFLPFYLTTFQKAPLFYGHFEPNEWALILKFDGRYLYRVPTGLLNPGIQVDREKIKKQMEWETRKGCFVFLCCMLRNGCKMKRLLKHIFQYVDLKRRIHHFTPIPGWRTLPPMEEPTYVVGRKFFAYRAKKCRL